MEKSNLQSKEILTTTQVSDTIVCKDCAKRDDSTIYSNPYTKSSCQAFPYPMSKPYGVLIDGDDCPEYVKEGTDE